MIHAHVQSFPPCVTTSCSCTSIDLSFSYDPTACVAESCGACEFLANQTEVDLHPCVSGSGFGHFNISLGTGTGLCIPKAPECGHTLCHPPLSLTVADLFHHYAARCCDQDERCTAFPFGGKISHMRAPRRALRSQLLIG